MAGSTFGAGSGSGSTFTAPAAETTFTDLRLAVQSQANALVAPSDSPIYDVTRLVEDASGNRVMWTWDASASTWKGVQVA